MLLRFVIDHGVERAVAGRKRDGDDVRRAVGSDRREGSHLARGEPFQGLVDAEVRYLEPASRSAKRRQPKSDVLLH